MNELKPCPFCGGLATLYSDYSSEHGKRFWQVWHACDGPEAERPTHYGETLFPFFETPWYESKETACKAWNRRV